MTTEHTHLNTSQSRAGESTTREESPVLRRSSVARGIASGVLGAGVVALFFLIVDLMAGRPLFTPAALGHQILLGSPLDPDAPIAVGLVVAYTLIHCVVFIAFGLLAASELVFPGRRTGLASGVLLVALFAVAFQVTFVGMGLLFAPDLLGELGVGRVAVANGAAAIAMALYLEWSFTARSSRGATSEAGA